MTMTREPIRPIKLEKPNRKINFDKEDIEADGKITLELFTNNITRLLVDLQYLGEPVVSFGHTVVHRFDASRIPDLEKLDSIAFGRVPSRPVRTNPPIPTSQLGDTGGTDKNAIAFGSREEGRKVSFAKADVDARGKIALDLVATDINQLVRDLYDLGVDGITTFGNNASVKLDANKIPALEQLPSLAFGRTPKREVSKEGEEAKPAKSKKGKTWEEIEAEGRAIVESYTKGIIVNPGNTWGGAYMLPGGDSPRDLVPGTPSKITAEEWLRQGSKRKGNEESKDNRGTKNKSQTKVGHSAGQNTRETNAEGVVPLSAPKEASQDNKGADLSVERVKKFPSETTPSTTIIIRSASFENQARQPAGLTRNAFGQPIPRPRFTSTFQTVGGSSSGGSSNSQGRRLSAGGQRVQWSRG